MQYGLCYLSVVPLRLEASDTSELVSQVLYGECFKVLEQRKSWSRIRLSFDKYEGWIDNKQFQFIEELEYKALHKSEPLMAMDLVDFITTQEQHLHPILSLLLLVHYKQYLSSMRVGQMKACFIIMCKI